LTVSGAGSIDAIIAEVDQWREQRRTR